MLSQFHCLLTILEGQSSKLDKIATIRAHLTGQPQLVDLFNLALSPYITFGVAKLPPANLGVDTPESVNLEVEVTPDWRMLFDRLANRQLTGNAALAAIGAVRCGASWSMVSATPLIGFS